MKAKIRYTVNKKQVERDISYIPVRYIIAILISVAEVLAILGIVIALCIHLPFFYSAAVLTQALCVIHIISSDDNPDYKVPWLLFILIIPVVGFMLYFLFYSRKLQKKYIKRLAEAQALTYKRDDSTAFENLKSADPLAASTAQMLTGLAGTCLFTNTRQTYYPLGEDMLADLLCDLETAQKFIYMEYYIIEQGIMWDSILEILKKKSASGVDVKVVYDDIGCMLTLPGNYAKILKGYGIDAVPFSRLRGQADSEFNNRNHRKMTVIDGKIGYTGGVNLADEYINKTVKYGHWKDTAIRLEGEAVWELTHLFLLDFCINVKAMPTIDFELYPKNETVSEGGFVIPFGDGPHPVYNRRVSKRLIQNMLASATRYMYITTPYLIIDNDLCTSLENAALRGVDVRIITPHIPDKKIVFAITRSYYKRLCDAGVRIYEYESGFIHAKNYIADGKCAMTGTINLDYRSLVHHFENGVWMYGCDAVLAMERDFIDTLDKSVEIRPEMLRAGIFKKLFYAIVKIFAPMM